MNKIETELEIWEIQEGKILYISIIDSCTKQTLAFGKCHVTRRKEIRKELIDEASSRARV